MLWRSYVTDGSGGSLLDAASFLEVWRDRPGLMPAKIDRERAELCCLDMGKYHIFEGRYRTAKEAYRTLMQVTARGSDIFECRIRIGDIPDLELGPDLIAPSAFIFHLSRCGSTLLSKVLARSRRTISIGEPGLEIGLWRHFAQDDPARFTPDPSQLETVKKVLTALGRPRLPGYQYHVIKSTSVGTLMIEAFRDMFPDTPFLYIYRDPREILASQLERKIGYADYQGTTWGNFIANHADTAALSYEDYLIACLGANMQHALEFSDEKTYFLHHASLTPERLDAILTLMEIDLPGEDIAEMSKEFGYYSKGFGQRKRFAGDQERKRKQLDYDLTARVKTELGDLYQQLLAATPPPFGLDKA